MRALIWVAAIALVLVGIASVIARLWYPADLTIRIEPTRNAVMERFSRADPLASQISAELWIRWTRPVTRCP